MNSPDTRIDPTAESIRAASCADDYDPNSMPVDKARAFIDRFVAPVAETQRLPLRAALGHVLAEDIVSPFDVPLADNSAMDGYALRHAEVDGRDGVTLKVVGTAFAGRTYAGAIGPGECLRIMTGGVVPAGLDCVVPQEHTRPGDGVVTFGAGIRHAQNVRYAGEDMRRDAVVLRRGQWLRPAETGLLASLGIGEVTVFRRLRVAFFSTGDELVSIGGTLGEGQVYDSNRYTIHGMLTRMGIDLIDMGVVRDDPATLEAQFAQAARAADVVITSGGVSVGEADFIKQMLERLGEVVFWKIAMKPGRPLAYGKIGGAHFFGLPGNPVSVMVTFYQFVREPLWKMMGRDPLPLLPVFKATCTTALKKAPGRTEFQRGVLSASADGGWQVRPTGEQGSGILSSMVQANCFIVMPEAQGNVAPGALVEVQMLEGLI
ncbi:MAG: molybdopterin molybdotransferase MoeA [Proteobacteria bacterium]|nr:molybdopterin molybdotransferase MoeA [Burkholderiales bacterium]